MLGHAAAFFHAPDNVKFDILQYRTPAAYDELKDFVARYL